MKLGGPKLGNTVQLNISLHFALYMDVQSNFMAKPSTLDLSVYIPRLSCDVSCDYSRLQNVICLGSSFSMLYRVTDPAVNPDQADQDIGYSVGAAVGAFVVVLLLVTTAIIIAVVCFRQNKKCRR